MGQMTPIREGRTEPTAYEQRVLNELRSVAGTDIAPTRAVAARMNTSGKAVGYALHRLERLGRVVRHPDNPAYRVNSWGVV